MVSVTVADEGFRDLLADLVNQRAQYQAALAPLKLSAVTVGSAPLPRQNPPTLSIDLTGNRSVGDGTFGEGSLRTELEATFVLQLEGEQALALQAEGRLRSLLRQLYDLSTRPLGGRLRQWRPAGGRLETEGANAVVWSVTVRCAARWEA